MTELGDFPAPISGEIFPEANTAYFISGQVDITPNTLNLSNPGVALLGFNRATDSLITNVAGPLITSSNTNLPLTAFTLVNPSGTLLNLTNTGVNVTILDKIFFGQCQSIGTISNYTNIILDNCGINSPIPIGGIVFSGMDWSEILIRDSFFEDWTGTFIDLGTSETDYFLTQGTRFLNSDPAAIAISGLPSAGNIKAGGLGTISACLFNGMTSPLSSIDHADSGWFISETVGVQLSDFLGYLNMHDNVTNTVISTVDTWVKVAGATTASSANERFEMTADNELTFEGLLPRPVTLFTNVIALKSGGGTDVVEFSIFKEPAGGGGFTIVDPIAISSIAATTNLASTSILTLDTAQVGDKYSVYARNTSGTSNLEIKDLQFSIRG